METSQKVANIQIETLKLVASYIEDMVNLCESEIEKLFLSNLIHYLFESKFQIRPTLYFSGAQNHNWDFRDFSRVIDCKDGPFFEEAEIMEFQKKGYSLCGCDFVKTIGIEFRDKSMFPMTDDIIEVVYKVIPQYIVSYSQNYRIDFAILCEHLKNGQAHKFTKIAIECDGFAYHSSKEDLTKDNSRNRELTLNDWKVYRFSGSEIYNSDRQKIDKLFSDIRKLAC